MKSRLIWLAKLVVAFGFDPRKMLRSMRDLPYYVRTLIRYGQLRRDVAQSFGPFRLAPCLGERFMAGGQGRGHYFHQDLLVARRIYNNCPESHVDVGSRLDGFVAHVASFRPVIVYDIRQSDFKIPNIEFRQLDFTGELPPEVEGVCDSLSCLHALEHFGLGRYGDDLEVNGHVRGLKNLTKLLRPGGRLYLSVPIGHQRVEFNAHRVFSVGYLLGMLRPEFEVADFSYVDDSGDLHESATMSDIAVKTSFGCDYGCGIFECVKK